MVKQQSVVAFTRVEAEKGIRRAHELGVEIPIEQMREIATKVRLHMAKTGLSFPEACREVLNGADIHGWTLEGRKRCRAFLSAISVMMSARKKFAKKKQSTDVERFELTPPAGKYS